MDTPGYPLTSKENSRRIRAEIRHVFFDIWDPIGVNDGTWPRDEYDGYLGEAFELLWRGASDTELTNYLNWMIQRMGMDGSRIPLSEVVRHLRAIRLEESTEGAPTE